MKQRRQILELAAADAEFALTTAIDLDSFALAVLVDREQLFDRAEPRRLRVDRLRRVIEPGDVGERVQVGVPGDAVHVWLEHRAGLVVDVGVFQIRPWERRGGSRVKLGVGIDVDRSAPVEALEVEHVHAGNL